MCAALYFIWVLCAPTAANEKVVEDTPVGAQRVPEPTDSPAEDSDSDDLTLGDYLLADLPPNTLVYEGERFRIRPIVAIVADYTFFQQDADSLLQVGLQEDTQDLRAARFGMYLRPRSERPWEFYVAVDYQEPRTREQEAFEVFDLRFRVPVGRVNFDIGKQKQPFASEVAGLSILYPQQERILSPFFVTRSIGIKASGQMANERMTWAVGWFNEWLETDASFSESGNDYVARMTGLAYISPDNRNYLHIGVGVRSAGPDLQTYRMSGRPESHVADMYVDTGDFTADRVLEWGADLTWQQGPFMFVTEYIKAYVNSEEIGNPRFSGGYVLLSWMLTGESRPYFRAIGSFGPITPTSRFGAFELVTRYSHIDLTDGPIEGGVLGKWYFGANWWISRQWKAGVGYGLADLDRDGVIGNTHMLLFRLQWFY